LIRNALKVSDDGAAAIEQAAMEAGHKVEVAFTPGRTDATQDSTDVKSFAALEPTADAFRNYYTYASYASPTRMMVEKADLLTLTVPQSGQGFNQEVVDAHGNIDGVLELFGYWQEVIPVIHANDIAYLGSLATLTGGHYRSEDVPVLGKNEAGQYTFTPHRIMGRTSGEDALYQIEQEWGSVPRFQSITAGTEMVLSNPNAAQVPQVVIRVVETSTTLVDPLITLNTTGTLAVTGDVQPGEYLKYEGGTTATVYDNNWNVLRTLPAVATAFETVTGENTVLTGSGAGATTSDLMVQYITLGTPYILEANNSL